MNDKEYEIKVHYKCSHPILSGGGKSGRYFCSKCGKEVKNLKEWQDENKIYNEEKTKCLKK